MRLLPAIAIVSLLAAALAAPAPAASPERGTIVRVKLELETNNGLEARLATSEDEDVTLAFGDKEHLVTYEVRGEVSETGLKVQFGRLGLIDVAFTPTNTLSSTTPSPGCTGAPRTLREGTFTGTIAFTGEREYVRIEASQATGSMSVISEWRCLDPATPFQAALKGSASRARGERETASLHADSRRCRCLFGAGVHHRNKGGRSIFYGAKGERDEGMEIVRSTYVVGAAAAFVFDHVAGTATLRPPRPLSGRAVFRRRPGGPDLWRSTIRVPLLGVDSLEAYGPGFRAGLYPEYHFD